MYGYFSMQNFENLTKNPLINSVYIYIYIYRVKVTSGLTLSNVTPLNNLLLNSYLKIQLLNYTFLMFLTCISIFMPIGCNLQFDPQTHLLCIILNYKYLNSNN